MKTVLHRRPENNQKVIRNLFPVQREARKSSAFFSDNQGDGPVQHRLANKINTSQKQRVQGVQLSTLFGQTTQLKHRAQVSFLQQKFNPLQRESSYEGLMPGHDTWGDSYTFAGEKSTGFTYHHIIPENKLKLVTKEFVEIKKYFDALEQREDNAALRSKGGELDTGVTGLITGAKETWFNTRVQDVTYAINHTHDIFGITVKESEVRTVMEDVGEGLPQLLAGFRDLLKPKSKRLYAEECGRIKGIVSQALNNEPFYSKVNKADEVGIRGGLSADIDTQIFDLDQITTQVMSAVREVRAKTPSVRNERGRKIPGPLNKGRLLPVMVMAIRSWTFEDYYRERCKALYENSTASDTHLKKLLQMKALPHDESEHLEHAVQWNPGNIHRGPSSSKRLDPDIGDGFDEWVDDGGDRFEKAAVNLVSTPHFKKLVKLNGDIDTFLVNKVHDVAPDDTKVDLAKDIVRQMKVIQSLALTQFNETKWEMKGEDKMRLKKNQELIDASQ